jgi:hypothetical protein
VKMKRTGLLRSFRAPSVVKSSGAEFPVKTSQAQQGGSQQQQGGAAIRHGRPGPQERGVQDILRYLIYAQYHKDMASCDNVESNRIFDGKAACNEDHLTARAIRAQAFEAAIADAKDAYFAAIAAATVVATTASDTAAAKVVSAANAAASKVTAAAETAVIEAAADALKYETAKTQAACDAQYIADHGRALAEAIYKASIEMADSNSEARLQAKQSLRP